MSAPSLFVTVPCVRGTVAAETALTLVGITADCLQAGIGLEVFIDPQPLAHALERDRLAARFLESPHTHHLHLDDDVAVPGSVVVEMLRHDKPIIGCVVASRRGGGIIVCAHRDVDGDHERVKLRFGVGTPPRRCAWVGGAVMMVARRTYELIAPNVTTYEGQGVDESPKEMRSFFEWRFDLGKDGRNRVSSEDITFCYRAEDAGLEVFMMTTIESIAAHVGRVVHGAAEILRDPTSAASMKDAAE